MNVQCKTKAQLILGLQQARTRTDCTLILLTIISLAGSSTARAQVPGDLDSTFNSVGFVITPIGTSNDIANAVAIQADGKIVAGGYLVIPPDVLEGVDMGLVRYNIDGSLDNSFGIGGKVVSDLDYADEQINWVGIQPDGKIVVAGEVYNFNNLNRDFLVARYLSDGTLDSSFATNGWAFTQIGPGHEQGLAGALQTDGKIVVVGLSVDGGGSQYFATVRYNSDGSVDTAFGTGGKISTPIDGNQGLANAVTIQTDGKILVTGNHVNSGKSDLAVVRFNTDGSLDNGFGTNGIVNMAGGSFGGFPEAIAVQSNGKIILGGYYYTIANYTDTDFFVKRLNSDGTVDTSFGTAGETITVIGASHDRVFAMALQPTGKIVVVGDYMDPNPPYYSNIAFVQYTSGGSLDTTFGDSGIVTMSVGPGSDSPVDVGLQSDGKIVLAGDSYNGSNNDFLVLRYIGDRPPLAINDTAATPEDTARSVVLLDNDSDPDNDPFAISSVGQGAQGTVAIDPGDTSVTYTPGADFTGADSFSYVITDGILNDTATVYMTVTTVNDPPVITSADSADAMEDMYFVYRATADDPDGPSLSWTFDQLPSSWLSAAADSVYGTPIEGTADTSFRVIAFDGEWRDTLVVTLTVAPYNDPPVAVNDNVTTSEDVPVTVWVVENDSDPEGMPLTLGAGLVALPFHGEVVIEAGDTTLTFTPDSNYFGNDTLKYRISDGYLSDTATVYITVTPVNDVPALAAPADTTINEDAGEQIVNLTGIGAGAANEDQFLVVTATSSDPGLIPHPAVTYTSPNTSGSLAIIPVTNTSGTVTITVKVKDDGGTADGGVDSTLTSFTVTVNSVNDAPTIDALSDATINEDASEQLVSLSGIGPGAANESQDLTVTATSSNPGLVPHPAVTYTTPEATGSLSYTPAPDGYGTAVIMVKVKDDGGTANGGLDTSIISFTVTVSPENDAPEITSTDSTTIMEHEYYVYRATADDPDGPSLSWTFDQLPSWVFWNTNADSVSGTPDEGTADTLFRVIAFDGELRDTLVVTLKVVPVSNPPLAASDAASTPEDTAVTIFVLANDSDPEGAPLTLDSALVTPPRHGEALIDAGDTTLTYTPANDYFGGDTLEYRVSDGYLSDTATVYVTVTPVNDPPAITSVAADTAREDEYFVYHATADDPDGPSPSWIFLALPGWVEGFAADSMFGTPGEGAGDTSFVVIADDGLAADTLQVVVLVVPVNDPPVAVNDMVITPEDTTIILAVLKNDYDVDGDTLSIVAVSDPANGRIQMNGDSTVTYQPDTDFHGLDSLVYIVTDRNAAYNTGKVYLIVTPVNDAPGTFAVVTITGDSTIQISSEMLADSLVFRWTRTTDVDGDSVWYIFDLDDGLSLLGFGEVADTMMSISLDTLISWIHQTGLTSISGTWDLFATDGEDTTWVEGGPFELTVDISTLDIRDLMGIPEEFALHQNYPNPFNPVTTLQYDLPHQAEVWFTIYDLLGREVARLVNGSQQPGYYQIVWNGRTASGRELPSGIYIARLHATPTPPTAGVTPEYTRSIKMVLLK